MWEKPMPNLCLAASNVSADRVANKFRLRTGLTPRQRLRRRAEPLPVLTSAAQTGTEPGAQRNVRALSNAATDSLSEPGRLRNQMSLSPSSWKS
jgi:hypothetical protein